MYKYLKKQTQKIRKEISYTNISIYTKFYKLVYIGFYIVKIKAQIYLNDKSGLFLLFKNFHCRSPPNPFNLNFANWMEEWKMKDNAKCFIRIEKGKFEEITYKELEKRRKTTKEYNNKKFVPVQGMLLEVTEVEYKNFYRDVERQKYVTRESKRFIFSSINEMAKDNEDNEVRGTDILPDENVDIDFEVSRRIEVEQLNNALLQLNDDEYKLIKALFFEQKTLREYGKVVGKHYTTIYSNRDKILEKLKKFLEI